MKTIRTLLYMKPLFPQLLLLLMLLAISSCRTKRQALMTESLYMQYKRVNIEYPYSGESDSHILTEEVDYTYSDTPDTLGHAVTDSTRLDTNQVYRLNEVQIQTRSRFASERNGRVAVDFLIRVPKELLSDNWRMTLTPNLLAPDTIVTLPDVVLSGSAFRNFQEQGYTRFEAYENSIVSPDAYDAAFLDRAGISRDIRRRQELFLTMYRNEFEQRDDYRKFRSRLEERHRHFNLQKDAARANLYHNYMRQGEMHKIRHRVAGLDTTGLGSTYLRKFEKRSRLFPHYRLHRELSNRSVPAKYRALHATYGRWGSLNNHSLSEQDSASIAAHRYLYDDIAQNEMKKALLDQTFAQLVPFPYRDAEDVKTDTLFLAEHNFFYLYRYEYPVTGSAKKLRVMLHSRVDAIDLSNYTLPPSDTLSYIISSMDQLADTTLIVKKSKVYRDVTHNLSVYFKFPANRWEFDVQFEDNRAQMDTLVGAWRHFTRQQGLIIDNVTMTAAASLDGNFQSNAKLSQRRVDALKNYLQTQYGTEMNVDQTFHTRSIGEDWTMARRLIREHPSLPNKETLLKKMAKVSDPDKVEAEIRWGFKKDYKTIREDIYPLLRRVDISFTMHRPNMEVPDSIHSEYRHDYAEALNLMQRKQYGEAMAILQKYADYNTALCLANMGQRENAWGLLRQLQQTPNVQYLSAIVLYQLGRKREAATHLLQACAGDPDKILRIPRDTDMKALVRDYGLQPQLDQLENSF